MYVYRNAGREFSFADVQILLKPIEFCIFFLFIEFCLVIMFRVVNRLACAFCGGCLPHDL